MKKASYRHGIEIIAFNDEPSDRDVESVSGSLTCQLLADLFAVEPERVAKDIVRLREKENI